MHKNSANSHKMDQPENVMYLLGIDHTEDMPGAEKFWLLRKINKLRKVNKIGFPQLVDFSQQSELVMVAQHGP
jgi:hypothetical protein